MAPIVNPVGGGNPIPNAPPINPVPLIPPNFGPLQFNSKWPTTLAQIVPGKFSSNNYQGLLFYDNVLGRGDFYNTNGQGAISPLQSHIGWRTTWTKIIPGYFHRKDFTGLLFYEKSTGYAATFDTDGQGNPRPLKTWNNWGTTWDEIVTVRVPGSDYTGLLFYDRAAGHGEIHRCDGNGGFDTIMQFDDWRTTWTHVVSDFFTTAEVFFYEGSTGYAEVWQLLGEEDKNRHLHYSFPNVAQQGGLPPATDIIPGNFGTGDTSVLFYDRTTGNLQFVFYDPGTPGQINFAYEENYQNWPTPIDILVAGDFWGSDTEDYKFQNGFSDLLFYDRSAGTGQFYFHEPYKMIIPNPFEGYANPSSVLQGDTICFYVNSQVGVPYQISIYQQGVTQKLMTTIQNVLPIPNPFPIGRQDYRDGPSWPMSAQYQIPMSWGSALYLARIEQLTANVRPPGGPLPSGGLEGRVALGNVPTVPPYDIPFVVRTKTPASQSKVLLVIPDCTYEAYNGWGGRALYGFFCRGGRVVWNLGSRSSEPDNHQTPRAFRVSPNRPFRDIRGFSQWQQRETPFISWLIRSGIEVEMCTGTDIHNDELTKLATGAPGLLSNYHMVVSVGHDEYWSKQMRDNVEGFAKEGGNLAFFSGNVSWWQIRFEIDPATGHIFQVCYKDARFDPINSNNGNPSLTTVNWDDTPVRRASTSLTGVSWDTDIPQGFFYAIRSKYENHWVFAGFDFGGAYYFGVYVNSAGQLQSVVGLNAIGSETDCYQPSSPSNLERLAEAPPLDYAKYAAGTVTATMGLFASGKGQVFTVGAINWPLGLSQDARYWTAMDQITLNVFNRFR